MILKNKNINYKFIKIKYIKILINKYLYNKKKINLIFVSLLNIFIINKIYNNKNYLTDILIFKNNNFKKNWDFYICNILAESESNIFFKKLKFIYINLIIHGFLHTQNFSHKKNFYKKNIFNFLELKIFYKLGLKNPYKYNFMYIKYK